jgi:hypothetical protein
MYLRLILLCALIGCTDADAQRPRWDFSFPSASTSSRSPAGALVVSYYDPGENQDGGHDYEFIVRGPSGRREAGFVFLRSVTGSWAPSGEHFFVNDYIGSNVTDCLVSQTVADRLSLVSLTELLASQRQNGAGNQLASITESPDNSHFYLTCSRWIGSDAIKVSVRGYTDETRESIREFAYDLRYVRPSRRLERVQ